MYRALAVSGVVAAVALSTGARGVGDDSVPDDTAPTSAPSDIGVGIDALGLGADIGALARHPRSPVTMPQHRLDLHRGTSTCRST